MTSSFRLEEMDGNVAVLTFDVPDSKVNTLSTARLKELEEIVSGLEKRTDLGGLLLRSGKPGQFVAGADLNELRSLATITPEQGMRLLELGHRLFDRFSKLPFPTVALVDGACMGGGTEWILALDYRICSNSPKTRIGLPEVTIGIIPGWGGTQRLPRVIGAPHAIEVICSGEAVAPDRAVALGLAFDAVPVEKLLEEGKRLLEYTNETGQWQTLRQQRSQPVGLSHDEFAFTFAAAEGYLRGKTKGHYPAPMVALRAIKNGCNLPLADGLEAEKQAALDVFGSPISANLIAMFFMNQRLERDPGVEDASIKPRDIRSVGVVGAGLMGAGIATAHARSGIPATMMDLDEKLLKSGLERAKGVVEGRIKIGRATVDDMAQMFAMLNTSTSVKSLSSCDMVIEAVTENEAVKRKVYQSLSEVVGDETIIASNTSTISITRLAESVNDPTRFVGMHFFNPVDRMQLVEVIRGERTSDQTVADTVALAKRVRKKPIVVRDCAGFLVNRVLFPYMNEALVLLLEGADMNAIDAAATRFGMPMGPILLQDVVGLDTASYAGKVLHDAYPDRSVELPLLKDLVDAGRLGQKSGKGFRSFDRKHPKGNPDPEFDQFLAKHRTDERKIDEAEITERLFLPMLLEATRCLEENIVREPADVDMGLILGTGFPAFRGGILRWCDQESAAVLLEKCQKYVSLGKRFEPTELLRHQAQTGEQFYPAIQSPPDFGA